jgi:hypothetical protein
MNVNKTINKGNKIAVLEAVEIALKNIPIKNPSDSDLAILEISFEIKIEIKRPLKIKKAHDCDVAPLILPVQISGKTLTPNSPKE